MPREMMDVDDRKAVKKNAQAVSEYTPMMYVPERTNAASVSSTVTARPPCVTDDQLKYRTEGRTYSWFTDVSGMTYSCGVPESAVSDREKLDVSSSMNSL